MCQLPEGLVKTKIKKVLSKRKERVRVVLDNLCSLFISSGGGRPPCDYRSYVFMNGSLLSRLCEQLDGYLSRRLADNTVP